MKKMNLRFADGIEFDTDGKYRLEERFDGFYVVGGGMLCPIDSREEGEKQSGKRGLTPIGLGCRRFFRLHARLVNFR